MAMGSLRRKLAFSYGLLIVIILAVSAWGIYHLVSLGRAVDVILVNNYKSIRAAENMKVTLERLDSSVIFFIAGQADKAHQELATNSERFSEEFRIAAGNITEEGEDLIIADIDAKYSNYKQEIEGVFNNARTASVAEQFRIYF